MFKNFLVTVLIVFFTSTTVFANVDVNDNFTEEELTQRITQIYNTYMPNDSWYIESIDVEEMKKLSRREIEQILLDVENGFRENDIRAMYDEPKELKIKVDAINSDAELDTGTSYADEVYYLSQTYTTYPIRFTFNVDWIKGYFYHITDVYNIKSRLYGTYLGSATWKQTDTDVNINDNKAVVTIYGTLQSSNYIAGYQISAIKDHEITLPMSLD